MNDRDMHQLVEEHEKATASWRKMGWAGAFALALIVAAAIGLFLNGSVRHRVGVLEDSRNQLERVSESLNQTLKNTARKADVTSARLRKEIREFRRLVDKLVETGQLTPGQATNISKRVLGPAPTTSAPQQPSQQGGGGTHQPQPKRPKAKQPATPAPSPTPAPGQIQSPGNSSVCLNNPLLPVCLKINQPSQ